MSSNPSTPGRGSTARIRIRLAGGDVFAAGPVRLARLLSMTDQIAAQLRGLHFTACHPAGTSWQPAVNVYAYADRLEVCMDLAGVDKREIRVDVEPRRLSVSGHRELPESSGGKQECGRILIMEIEDGRFERTLEFTTDIDTSRVEARQDNGWLWIVMPRVQEKQGGVS